jgi:alkane 1-monooxygenase
MANPLTYFPGLAIAFLVLGSLVGGIGYFALPFLAFVFFPVADHWTGPAHWPSGLMLDGISARRGRAYDAALVSAAVANFGVIGWGLWVVSNWRLEPWEFVGLTMSVGMFSSFIGIVAAHEMMHRSSRNYRRMAWVLMSSVFYPQFCIEHIRRHHVHVGTPEDHSTARRGQSLYAFIPTSMTLGLLSALRFRPLRMLGTYMLLGLLLLAIQIWLGAAALGLVWGQALVAVLLLEGINYLEHYGLCRARRPDGRYEPPGPGHSWDSSHSLTNGNMFNLGCHTDHHSNGRRPYYRLRQVDAAPKMPSGYPAMFLIALVPPLWFRVMHPLLDELKGSARVEPDVSAQKLITN